MFWSVLFARSHLRRRARSEAGFGMIELLAAMTVMLIGIFAVFSVFQAGIVQIRRASTVTTAAAIADSEMENFRAIKYEAIGLASSNVTSVVGGSYGSTYTGQTFYKTDSAATTTLTSAMTASQLTIPVASGTGFPSTGPFLVKIDSELILVNDRTTTPWSVRVVGERGYLNGRDSSYYGAAAAHSAGATVSWVQKVDVKACGATPCTNAVATKAVTGADGRSYKVDTYITWRQITNSGTTAGRLVKLVSVVVRDNTSPYRVWARVSASFDEGTGS
jgi:Tfp pilus assembly protein PilV